MVARPDDIDFVADLHLYCFGIIDPLTMWGSSKQAELWWKTFTGGTGASVQRPDTYAQRFADFVKGQVATSRVLPLSPTESECGVLLDPSSTRGLPTWWNPPVPPSSPDLFPGKPLGLF